MYPGYEFNLQRTALFSIGRTIWQHPRVSADVKDWFDVYSNRPFSPTGEWHRLVEGLLNQIHDQTSLPAHLENELAHVIKEMGHELRRWLDHVKHMNRKYYRLLCRSYWETLDCPKSIHWTRHCTIDVRRTVEASWVSNPHPRKLCGTYHMAVRSGIPEDKVHGIWRAMSDLQRMIYRGLFDEEYAVHAYYEYHREGKLDELRREIKENRGSYRRPVGWDDRISLDENVFWIFVSEGYPEAARMVWARMDDLAGERAIEDGATVALERWRSPVRNYDDFMSSRWADLSVYLASRLTDGQRTRMLDGQASDWLRMIGVAWPWREFFVKQMSLVDLTEDANCDGMLYDMAERLIGEEVEAGYAAEGSKNQRLFQHCWRHLPREAKLNCQEKLILAVITLIRARDMNSAQMVLSSPEVADNKPLMLRFAHCSFEDMMVNGEFEILERFVDANFETEREKRTFKMSLLPHAKFVLRGRFDLAEKCLDWQCKTEREKATVKMAIDFRPIAEDPYRRENTARRFLDWQCASLERQRNAKSGLNCKFAKDLVYKLWIRWKTKMPKTERKAFLFFDWYIKMEVEIVMYSVRRIAGDELIALIVEAMVRHNYVDIVDNLKCWCSMTNPEVKEVRRKILDSAIVPICRHYIEEGEIQVSRGFLGWFEDDEQRRSFVNHFVANRGSTSCYLFIASDRSVPSRKRISKFRDFLNAWIEPLEEAQLKKFKSGVSFQAKKTKYKQPEDCKNYEIFQSLLSEMT